MKEDKILFYEEFSNKLDEFYEEAIPRNSENIEYAIDSFSQQTIVVKCMILVCLLGGVLRFSDKIISHTSEHTSDLIKKFRSNKIFFIELVDFLGCTKEDDEKCKSIIDSINEKCRLIPE
jgi:hypothetical protein